MEIYLQKLNNHNKNQHFALYSYTFFIMGATLNGIGPLIPYMSDKYHVQQVQYSILFPGRTLGYIAGIFLAKLLLKKFTYHRLMLCSVLWLTICSIGFNFSQTLNWQILYISVNAIALAFYDVIVNISLLIFNQDQDKSFWFQTAYGAYGIGALTSPIIAYFFQLNTFLVFAIMNVLMAFGYWKLQSPEVKKRGQKIQQLLPMINKNNSSNQTPRQINQTKNIVHQQSEQISNQGQFFNNQSKQVKLRPIPRNVLVYLAILIFVYAGLESSYAIWIPTYSVLTQISNKEQATLYSMVFYLSVTISHFLFAIPTKNKTLNRTKICLILIMLISILAVFLHFYWPHFGCYLVSILYGFAISPLYSWYLTISHEYGFQLSPSDYSSILVICMLGPTFFPMLIGYLFYISLSMIFVVVFVMALLQYFLLQKIDKGYERQLQKQIQFALIQTKDGNKK